MDDKHDFMMPCPYSIIESPESNYITKPFQPEEVLARIQTQLTIQQQKQQLREQI